MWCIDQGRQAAVLVHPLPYSGDQFESHARMVAAILIRTPRRTAAREEAEARDTTPQWMLDRGLRK